MITPYGAFVSIVTSVTEETTVSANLVKLFFFEGSSHTVEYKT